MKVLELMKVHVIRASMDATIGDAVDMMDLYQVTSLPIVDADDKISGIVTESDVVRALLPVFLGDSSGDSAASLPSRSQSVLPLSNPTVVAVDEGDDVLVAAELMLRHGLDRLPVTGEDRLVGTIGRIDICQAILEGQLTSLEPHAGD